jgi:hypothetical protein
LTDEPMQTCAILALEPLLSALVGSEHAGGTAEVGDHVRDRGALRDAQVLRSRARELEHLVLAAAGGQAAQQLEDDVLGLDPGPVEPAAQVDFDHLGAGDLVRVPAEHDRDVESAGAVRDHAHAARLRRVRIGAEHRLPRLAEALHVDVVTDPVPGPREVQAVLARQRLQHAVIVGVLVVELDDVVIDVLDRTVDLDARLAQLLELHQGHGSRGVLKQRLVHAERDRTAWFELAVGQVRSEDLVGETLGHCNFRRTPSRRSANSGG